MSLIQLSIILMRMLSKRVEVILCDYMLNLVQMVMMIQSGLPIERVITHRFHYTEFQEGFDIMRSGQSGKVILDWKD